MASKKSKSVRDSSSLAVKADDSLINFYNAMGTTKDPSTGYQYTFVEIPRDQLNAAYRGSWLAKKIVDVPAKDATSKWRRWQADKSDITKIEEVEKRFDLQRKLKKAIIRARLFGGCGIVIGVANSGASSEPLDMALVKKDSLLYAHVMSKHELIAGQRITDPQSPWFGQPEKYTVTVNQTISSSGSIVAQEEIHPSRVVQLLGEELPDTFMASSDGWAADSVLQSCDEAIRGAGIVTGGLSALIGDMKFDIIGVPGLTSQMGDKDYKKRLLERFAVANLSKSICNALLMDAEEKWDRVQTTLAGLPEVVRIFMEMCGGASGIPISRLIGPGQVGLGGNASGETDIVNYYDSVTNEQETVIGPAMRNLDEVLVISALGKADESIYYNWTPLREMTENQKADLNKIQIETVTAVSNTGLVNEDALREGLVNLIIEQEMLPGFESAIDEFGSEPPEPEQPVIDPAVAAALGAGNQPPKKATQELQAGDAAPRTLYVRRDVLNGEEIKSWAADQGFPTTVPAEQMHVTIIYSRTQIDWMKTGEDWGGDKDGILTINPGGARVIEPMGKAIALLFNSSRLAYRHEDFKRVGAETDYPDYQPHISLTFAPGDLDIKSVVPYRGEIRLGPEVFEEVKDGDSWRDTFTEDSDYTKSRGRPWPKSKPKQKRKKAK